MINRLLPLLIGFFLHQGLLADETTVTLDADNTIVYEGDITAQANTRAMELFEQAPSPPRRLLITSNGGKLMEGLDLAEWIVRQQLDVEVGEQCLSSCANYIFPAGRTKWLRRDSVLVWHGSAWQASLDAMADPNHADYAPLLVETRRRETQFFADLDVDNLITIYGQTTGRRFRLRRAVGFDYALSDLKRFGITNIELIDGEWNWRTHKPKNADRVIRVELDDDYRFTLNRFSVD